MADPMTMALVGAGIGAATNQDDPIKGAMMGAALGGIGGSAIGGAGAAGGAELAAAESAPVTLAKSPMLASELATAGPPAWYGPSMWPEFQASDVMLSSPGEAIDMSIGQRMPADLSWMDTVSKGQQAAIGTGSLPGLGGISPMSAMSAMNLMKPQQQPQISGSVRRGDPRALNDAIVSLLAPKQVAKRKISLL